MVGVVVGGGLESVVVVVEVGVTFVQFTVSDLALTFVELKAFGQVIDSEFPARSVRLFVIPDAPMPRSNTLATANVAKTVMMVLFIRPPAICVKV